ncbi:MULTISPECIES: hypothetical protein [unclassified Enterococcus]|uniref:hypothetical protein n=1 Tax=unclassified Enterococcus TaxID=2608891 RepID=UPI0013EA613A|nr:MULTISPECIES: hypothetical protein [unclassified Enterococcus]
MKLSKKIIFTFITLLISYCILLTIIYSIPQKFIDTNVDKSIQMLANEGLYPTINKGNAFGTRLDNFTDNLMIFKAKSNATLNPLENAMFMGNYPRYWHGYQLFLRPLLIVMTLGSIRTIYATVLFVTIGLTTYFLIKHSDIYLGIAFLIAIALGNASTFFFSMQFSNIWILTLLATLLFLIKPNILKTNQNMFLYFFIIGSLANFFDLLTTPIVSWGIPIVIIFYLNNKKLNRPIEKLKNQLINFVLTGIFWGLGYGLTWVAKWCISSIILRKNIIKDAINQIIFRTEGNDDYPLHRLEMLKNNFKLMYPKVTILILVITCLFFIYIAYRKRNNWHPFHFLVLFVLAAVTPYIWYNILANHSQIHYWFTYRTQIITSFAILSAFAFLIPPEEKNDELFLEKEHIHSVK